MSHLYASNYSDEFIHQYQLAKFNKIWSEVKADIPFYRYWSRKHQLPNKLMSLDELKEFPKLSKETINEHRDLIFKIDRKYSTISTGGSTGNPTLFPYEQNQLDQNYGNLYAARGWWNVQPLDKTVLLWGHSHLFGSVIKGALRNFLRSIKDNLINTKRLNAYTMSVTNLELYYQQIVNFSPRVLIGYTSCIFKISRYILDNAVEVPSSLSLKAIIVTAESVSKEEVDCIQKAFNAPVVIEYGSAEMGVVSYSKSDGNSYVLWDSFFCYANERRVLSVTTLDRRSFPLINYYTQDIIQYQTPRNRFKLKFLSIKDRAKKFLLVAPKIGQKLSLSGNLIFHILKTFPNIYLAQCTKESDDEIINAVVSDKALDLNSVKNSFLCEIRKSNLCLAFGSVEFIQVKDATRTLAGKEMLVT